ncbi:hypothetical protein L7F22_055646 [Adiantum nelumboides]|nr:hypothetical protein [Adiantum nelumboides]
MYAVINVDDVSAATFLDWLAAFCQASGFIINHNKIGFKSSNGVVPAAAVSLFGSQCGFLSLCTAKVQFQTGLTANCSDGNGGSVSSLLDLNERISNQNGVAVCGSAGGNFIQTCVTSGLALDRHNLKGSCLNGAGVSQYFTLDLDKCVGVNSDGQLAYCV